MVGTSIHVAVYFQYSSLIPTLGGIARVGIAVLFDAMSSCKNT